MKKFIVLLMAVFMVFSICACKKQEVNSTNNTAVTDDVTSGSEENTPLPAITVEDVKNVFFNDKSFEGCEITDCVIANDNAYGLIGVVQYTDKDGNPSWLAFVNKDGAYPVGLDADNTLKIAEDSILTYIGNGTVALTLEKPDTGEVYDYTMTYAYDEATNHTSFKAASNIRK